MKMALFFIRRIRSANALVCGLILYTLLSGCSDSGENLRENGLTIVTTTGMIADAVKNIVKDSAEVQPLMGPGVDPHLYKATQGDLSRLSQADIVFYNGLHLEGKMGEVLEKLGRVKPVVSVTENLSPDKVRRSPEFKNAVDPHVWFDVSLWKEVVGHIGRQLKAMDTANADYYQQNMVVYQKQLDSLHQAVAGRITTIPKEQRLLITAHDAFGYFGDAYGIEVKGLQGISTMSDFGLRDITDLVNLIIQRRIKSVFVETSVSDKAIKAVVKGVQAKGEELSIGGKLYSDAMGEEGTKEGTYIGMVNANVETIVSALK